MNQLERLAPRDRRMLLALSEMELASVRRPELEAARARALLARWPKGPWPEWVTDDWWEAAGPLVSVALGTSPKLNWNTVRDLAIEHPARIGLTGHIEVVRAMLAHVHDWSALDDAGRHAAIDEQEIEVITRDLDLLAAAGNAHGMPVSAFDLHPPLTWPARRTDRLLGMYVARGDLFDTGERRDGWPVYDLSSHRPSLVQPAGDTPETEMVTASPSNGTGPPEDAA